MMTRNMNPKIIASKDWKQLGFVPEVTWGLNLMLGEAPAKGSVQRRSVILPYEMNTSIRPLYFFNMENVNDI